MSSVVSTTVTSQLRSAAATKEKYKRRPPGTCSFLLATGVPPSLSSKPRAAAHELQVTYRVRANIRMKRQEDED